MVSYMSLVIYGIGGIVVAGMALLVAFQEKLVYVPVLPGLTKTYPITPAHLPPPFEDVREQRIEQNRSSTSTSS
ncbi:hypothetical protein HanXRQr2_Chr09g0378821 [Helianthus annuus]|uniref:Uncharacterized protein n=1 Tax=Helianthus annuus TaxID=4232 RepID=A0A9K3I4P7_HELAN|nr:hypothetical protein HanXRQr2_Chr09g0378821 [Helianthus annuus]